MRAEPSSLTRPLAQTVVRPVESPRSQKKPVAKKLPVQPTTVKKAAAKKLAAKKPARKKLPKKSRAAELARITQVLDALDQLYPDAHCELNYNSAFELLVAVILSAQCTDDRVNMITPELFRRYPDPQALATSELTEVERIIYSTGFFHNKAKNIRAAAKMIVDKFAGQVPQTLDELLSLPGVARKTANVVLTTAFQLPAGIIVDTHVKRVSSAWG